MTQLPAVNDKDLAQLSWLEPEDQLEHFARIALSVFAEPSDSHMGYMISIFGPVLSLNLVLQQIPINTIRELLPEQTDFEEFTTRHLRAMKRYQPRISLFDVQRTIEMTNAVKATTLVPQDLGFPNGLHDLDSHSPWLLWFRGQPLSLESYRAVSIVGTRTASDYGLSCTRMFAEFAAQENLKVISGGAVGCDAAAHEAALNAGGQTFAFLAGGIDQMYPWQNRQLFQKIMASGAVFSESPPGTMPTKWRFLRRNRLIAAASRATLVVEAGWRSGTKNTAEAAAELGRDVGVVPGPIDYFGSQGCYRILQEMPSTVVHDRESFLNLVGISKGDKDSTPKGFLGNLELRCLDALGPTGKGIYQIARETGMSEFETNIAISSLELLGYARRCNSGWRRGLALENKSGD